MKMFISDIDGTLIKSDGSLSAFSKEGLTRIINSGVLFTVASARSVFSIQQVLQDVPIRMPIISFNGAFISCFEKGTHEIVNSIKINIAHEIYDIIKEFKLSPFISTHNQKDHLYHDEIINDGISVD